MTVEDLVKICKLDIVTLPMPKRQIQDVYIGDLLSFVMGRMSSDSAWITIMSNINIVAVATLSDASCIILAEGVVIDEEVKSTAKDKNVNILSSSLSAYKIAKAISNLEL